jgi:NitT/TauT family transport system substrate-binding protein
MIKLMKPFFVVAVFSATLIGFTENAKGESKRLAVGISALSAIYAPLYIAKDVGLFEKNGLDVDLVLMEFAQIVHAIISGDIAAAGVGATRIVASKLEGSGIVILATVNDRMPYKLIVRPEINSPTQLKGGKLGVARFGGLDDTAMRFALSQMGLNPDKDVTILQVGGKAARFAAMQRGAVAGIIIDPPYTLTARKLGMNTLFDLVKTSPEMVFNGTIAGKESYIKENPEVIRKLLMAFVAGVNYYRTHKAESIKIMAKYMRIDLRGKTEQEEMEETYDLFVKTVSCKPYASLEGIQNLLKEFGKKNPKANTAEPQSFVDMRFIREADESGLIDSVCK